MTALLLLVTLAACGDKDTGSDPADSGGGDDGASDTGSPPGDTGGGSDSGGSDSGGSDSGGGDTGGGDTGGGDTGGGDTGGGGPDPFADAVISFTPGEGAGYGADDLPDVVLGGPEAPGDGGGSLDVLSLGDGGEIVLAFTDIGLVDGDGPDLLVFENPFAGWPETGVVAVSEDGETWHEWPCDAADADGDYPGCAGVGIVYANSDNGVDPTDPEAAGGDAFDLADLGLARARFVRIRDTGENDYAGTAGGFDLDAVAVVNGESL